MIDRARGLVQDAMAIGYIQMPKGSQAPSPSKLARKAVARARTISPKKHGNGKDGKTRKKPAAIR